MFAPAQLHFNGTKLVSGSTMVASALNGATGADNLFEAADGVSEIEFDEGLWAS